MRQLFIGISILLGTQFSLADVETLGVCGKGRTHDSAVEDLNRVLRSNTLESPYTATDGTKHKILLEIITVLDSSSITFAKEGNSQLACVMAQFQYERFRDSN